MRRVLSIVAPIAAALLVPPAGARAIPGPDSVAVLANAEVPGSVRLARRYAEARAIPDRQVCVIPMPATEDVSLDVFRTSILEPFERCLREGGVYDRIEAVVIMRGVPLRLQFEVDGRARRVSLAAALALWQTTLPDGTPLLGRDPGREVSCGGTPCLAAAWASAYAAQPFYAGWTGTRLGVVHRPVLVTMLHGRSDADAERLIDAALAAEDGGANGEFLFMEGADPARGVLDVEYDGVIAGLRARGLVAQRVPFDADLRGRSLAAFFTGTASLGATIEGNEFRPGALVDNVTSFGALPENFRESGEVQVSIARWVARGVTGVHGTTDEPLNNCFPSRRMILDYVDGATLAEAYFGRLPYVYWHNLVLGDAMAAPYAQRPTVTIEGLHEGEWVEGARRITVRASAAAGRVLEALALYVDGVEVARSDGAPIEHCLRLPEGEAVQVLAVATVASDPERWGARGWTSVRATSRPGAGECGSPDGDAGLRGDAGAPGDSGTSGPPPSGGGCRAAMGDRPASLPLVLVLAALAPLAARRARQGGTVSPRSSVTAASRAPRATRRHRSR
jgi:uncharacterized protein (TIGR03790 family)